VTLNLPVHTGYISVTYLHVHTGYMSVTYLPVHTGYMSVTIYLQFTLGRAQEDLRVGVTHISVTTHLPVNTGRVCRGGQGPY
jgi:hypothetical protein